jgi:hypothetical protein
LPFAYGGFIGWRALGRNPKQIDIPGGPPQIWGVTEVPKPKPHLTPAAAKAHADREARQAEALRANLRRRKAQSRGREAAQDAGEDKPHSVYPTISDEV